MKLKILGHGRAEPVSPDLTGWKQEPAFRKATSNMILSTVACKQALAAAASPVSMIGPEREMLLLGSALGEFEATKDFLTALYNEDLARPFLFQNSLHNSILGFLTIQLNWLGPGMSLSNGDRTAQDLVEMAARFLAGNEADTALICMTDSDLEDLRELETGAKGAWATLLTRSDHSAFQEAKGLLASDCGIFSATLASMT